MRILIAPDKFKGSLSAQEVADSIAAGLRDVLPDAAIEIVPIADGGEGTAAAICQACSGEWVICDAHDALGRAIQARYVWLAASSRAVMEMSEAAGLWRIPSHERNPLRADTAGVGEMLLAAAGRGAKEIIIGLGGSATNDGGFGVARALGYRFFDSNDVELTGGPDELVRLKRVERSRDDDVGALLRSAQTQKVKHIAEISAEGEDTPSPGRFTEAPLHLKSTIIAATDVRNPLLGEHGATYTFGPQKGASRDALETLESALTHLADIVVRDLGVDHREVAGSGAAGGLGFGLMSFCGATIRSGFDLIAETIGLDAAVQRADVVITGEGRLDDQTLSGKAPAGVAQIARRLGKRVFAIVGSAAESPSIHRVFDGVFPLVNALVTPDQAMSQPRELLRRRGGELGRALLSCS